jgi:hypothetical protein
VDALFFMLGSDRYGFPKRSASGHHYVELVFLHPLGSVGHLVHSSVLGLQNIEALFFMLRWDRYGFYKKCDGTCYVERVFLSGGICGSRGVFQCIRRVKRRCTYFHARVGTVRIAQKAR